MSLSNYGNQPRLALTLLELVVVLGILAVLSTVAIRSLEPIADQARYEQTQVVLNNLRGAIVGQSDFRPTTNAPASGFVLDVGALPTTSAELLVRPLNLIDRTLQSFDSDRDLTNDVSLSSGWNGPYLHLTAGLDEIVDGWGRELSFVANAGDLELLSLGSDGDSTAPETGYGKDVSVTITQEEYLGTLVFRLFDIDNLNGSRIDPSPTGLEKLGVLFYGVNATGATTGAIAEQLINIDGAGSFEFRRNNTLIGITAARAILWDDTDNDDELDANESIIKKSIVHYPLVQPRLETRVEMELR